MKAIPGNRFVLFFLIAVGGVAADLLTKGWIFSKMWPARRGETIPIVEGYLAWQISLNEGALFGIGQGLVWLFATLSIVAVVGILYWLFVVGEARNLWLCIALASVTGGIFGNLYDRIGMHGLTWPADSLNRTAGEPIYAVRDWILLSYQGHLWPNFNIADCMLVCGAIMIGLHALGDFFGGSKKASVAKSPEV